MIPNEFKTLQDAYREYQERVDKERNMCYTSGPVVLPNLGCPELHDAHVKAYYRQGCEDPGDTFSVKNQQVGGNHYKGKPYQPWDIIDTWELNYYEGNVLKYLLRWRYKNGLEDLKKAQHYLSYLIEKEEKNATSVARD